MKLSLQEHIILFTVGSCLLFIMVVISIFWSSQVIEVAFKREKYANKVESHTNALKQFIISDNIYTSNHNIQNWFALERSFNNLLKSAPSLTPQEKTIQNSIESQNKSVKRLFTIINKNKFKHANERISKHLRTRLITQLEAIRSDSIQFSSIVQKDIQNIIRRQVIIILALLALSLTTLLYGASKLIKIFKTSLEEVKAAFENNHSGHFQKIKLSHQSLEFNSIANAFNSMNKKLSDTTVSLASMKKTVAERTHALEQLSNTDPLTKVANRRALFERGNAEFSRIQRTRGQLTIILLDCDYFKEINDQFGHLFGDEVLKNICRISNKEIRNIDFFARYGGEEFIIIFPDCDLNGAVETAKRIQCSLANNCIALEGKEISVTVSIGICTASKKHDNFEQLIKDADVAMYEAKKNGRNRIEVIGDNILH